MVSSPDKKALYAIGGQDGNWGIANDVFKFHCSVLVTLPHADGQSQRQP